jgi:hypothetical protein
MVHWLTCCGTLGNSIALPDDAQVVRKMPADHSGGSLGKLSDHTSILPPVHTTDVPLPAKVALRFARMRIAGYLFYLCIERKVRG